MKLASAFVMAAAFLIPCGVDAQESNKLQDALVAREKQMADAWKKKDAKTIKSLMAEDYVEINPFGLMTKKDVFEQIYPHIEVTHNAGKGYKLLTPTKSTAILTYHFEEKGKYKGKDYALETLVSAHY